MNINNRLSLPDFNRKRLAWGITGAMLAALILVMTAYSVGVRLWDASRGVSMMTIADFTDPIYNVIFYKDGSRLIANSTGSEIVLCDTLPYSQRIQRVKK